MVSADKLWCLYVFQTRVADRFYVNLMSTIISGELLHLLRDRLGDGKRAYLQLAGGQKNIEKTLADWYEPGNLD